MTKVSVPVFDGTHYEVWSVKMKTLLKAIDLWDVVETGIQQESPEEISWASYEFVGESNASSSSPEYNSASWKQWMEMKDTTALHLIQNGLTTEIFSWIASATSSKEAWELLLVRSLGGPKFQARKLLDLKKEYENLKMSEAETIHQFTGKLMELVFRMKSCGWEVEDKEVVKKILFSLPMRFDEMLVEVGETLSISDLIDYLLVHEYNTKPVQESLEEPVIESVEESLQEELNHSRRQTLNSLRERLNSSRQTLKSLRERLNSSRQNLKSLREKVNSRNEVTQRKPRIRKFNYSQVALTEIRETERLFQLVMLLLLILVCVCMCFV